MSIQSKSNVYIEHRIVDKNDLNGMRAWDNARFVDEYYINVTGVDINGEVDIVYGDKSSKEEYEKANEALGKGKNILLLR